MTETNAKFGKLQIVWDPIESEQNSNQEEFLEILDAIVFLYRFAFFVNFASLTAVSCCF